MQYIVLLKNVKLGTYPLKTLKKSQSIFCIFMQNIESVSSI